MELKKQNKTITDFTTIKPCTFWLLFQLTENSHYYDTVSVNDLLLYTDTVDVNDLLFYTYTVGVNDLLFYYFT